jgi:hypothetical protein
LDVRIDTLRLKASGIGEDPTRQLADLIAWRLSAALPPAARPGNHGRLAVTFAAEAGDTLEGLADGVAARVLHALSASGGLAQPTDWGRST